MPLDFVGAHLRQWTLGKQLGLRSHRKNQTAPPPELSLFMNTAPASVRFYTLIIAIDFGVTQLTGK